MLDEQGVDGFNAEYAAWQAGLHITRARGTSVARQNIYPVEYTYNNGWLRCSLIITCITAQHRITASVTPQRLKSPHDDRFVYSALHVNLLESYTVDHGVN
jgi:hypothetical protein